MNKILFFTGQNCKACYNIKEFIVYNTLLERNIDYEEIDVEEQSDIASRYNISSIPTFLVVNDRDLVIDSYYGITSKLLNLIRDLDKQVRKENYERLEKELEKKKYNKLERIG